MTRPPDQRIDVVTTAIPRGLTAKCIRSFLDHWADRRDYYARWIFHLDNYPGLEDLFERTLQQARELTVDFDDSLVLYHEHNIGYGASLRACWTRVTPGGPVLNIEDDWLWEKDFRLADVEDAADDGFSFCQQSWRIGGTSPCYWQGHVLAALLNDWPQEEAEIREVTLKRILHRKHGFRHGTWGKVPQECCREIGRQWLKGRGYAKNFFGREL